MNSKLSSSINNNETVVKICFCSGKAIEKNCEECYWISKEVKINSEQQQQEQYINKSNNTYNNSNSNTNNNNIYKEEDQTPIHEINKKRYRKSAEICFCSFPAREINCDNCRFSIPIEEDDNNNFNNNSNEDDDDFNSFINECSNAIINQDCISHLKSFVL